MVVSVHRERVYLSLAIAGTVMPLLAFAPWLLAHGLDVELFIGELFANRISAFFGWDVIVSALTILAALVLSPGTMTNAQKIGVAVGTLGVGVSLGLPLYLYFQEQARTRTAQ